MNETNRSKFKKRAAAVAVASCLSLTPFFADAAGLGKLTVFSNLGQPLRAELEVAAAADELSGMTARLAPQDVFRQTGIDYATVLLDLNFAVAKRPDGRSVVKVTSSKPINEPFLDFLVELNWPAGRLVREYTFLLDPPELANKMSGRQVADARVVETVRGAASGSSPKASARTQVAKVAETAPKAKANDTRVVANGDTLRKIAGETQYDGVSLDQMLVGLFRKNPDAFMGENINRLKAGAILRIPEKSAVESVPEGEARKIYLAHAHDWNAYRQKLAGATGSEPAKDDSSSQSASGKITAKVEEKAAPAEQSKDQVKVARADSTSGKLSGAAEAERIAQEKALKEAQDRLALLEKNVNELQKLLDLKNQKLAELQQNSGKKASPEAVTPPAPVEPPKQADAPAKVEEALKAPMEPAQPVEAQKPAEPVAPPPPPPVSEKPAPVPQKKIAPPPEPEPEPSFVDDLLSDPLPLAAGGGALAALLGFFLLKRRRSQSASVETTAIPGPSSLGPNSVFRMTGGQSVDTGNTPPQTGDFSQTGPGTIDTDEVDPVAEADVYMAYGRDTQAEEILLEALQKDPQRTAIHAKLLEIYANRRSVKQFETLASELYAQTGGVGQEWEKVAALGADLDPENPLYSGAPRAGKSGGFDADATMIVSPDSANKATLAMPGALSQLAESVVPEIPPEDSAQDTVVLSAPDAGGADEVAAAEVESDQALPEIEDGMSLDFDLGESIQPTGAEVVDAPAADETPFEDTVALVSSDALDFDLGGEPAVQTSSTLDVGAESPSAEASPELEQLDQVGTETSVSDIADFGLEVPEESSLSGESVDSAHDFSPEGTLVMHAPVDDEALDAGISTFVGIEGASELPAAEPSEAAAIHEDVPMVDFDLDMGTPATDTVVMADNQEIGSETVVMPGAEEAGLETVVQPDALSDAMEVDNPKLAETVVDGGAAGDSLEFDVKLTDSVFLGQPMMAPDFDIGSINLDLGAEPEAATSATSDEAPEEPAIAEEPVEPASMEASHDAHWEEVNTKLDLAKAYEEMGDLEGARELLQEVIGEGSADLVEQARSILGRIGG